MTYPYTQNEDYKPSTRDVRQIFLRKNEYIVKCRICGTEYRSYKGWTVKVQTKLCYQHRSIFHKRHNQKKYKKKTP